MKPRRTLITVSAMLAMAGCASHIHLLDKSSAPSFLEGEFCHEDEPRLVLVSSERRYEAHGFEVRSSQNLAELRKRYYGSSPKHWDRITSGLDTEHKTYAAEPVLKARDGSELSCHVAWQSGQAPAGLCVDRAGREYPLRFE